LFIFVLCLESNEYSFKPQRYAFIDKPPNSLGKITFQRPENFPFFFFGTFRNNPYLCRQRKKCQKEIE
jgi:hypothetical protein